MATITSYTLAKMQSIEDNTIVSGAIVGDDLILTKNDTTTVNAGNVRGPQGVQGPEGPAGDSVPPGTIIQGKWGAGAPTGYFLLDGSTKTGGATSYPDLAAAWPEWVSGSDIVLPNANGNHVLLGTASGWGVTGGSNSHTLSTGNLPVHDHSLAAHTHTPGSFSVDIDHDHGAFNTSSSGPHTHDVPFNTNPPLVYKASPGFGESIGTGINDGTLEFTNDGDVFNYNSMEGSGEHLHSINVPNYNTSNRSVVGTSGAPNTTNTGETGSGTAVDHTPLHLKVRTAVKY